MQCLVAIYNSRITDSNVHHWYHRRIPSCLVTSMRLLTRDPLVIDFLAWSLLHMRRDPDARCSCTRYVIVRVSLPAPSQRRRDARPRPSQCVARRHSYVTCSVNFIFAPFSKDSHRVRVWYATEFLICFYFAWMSTTYKPRAVQKK